MTSFTSVQLEKITGLKANTLHFYIQGGAITPGIQASEGRGRPRLFSPTDLVEVFVLKWLMDLGLPRKFIFSFFRELRAGYGEDCMNPEKIASGQYGEVMVVLYPSASGADFRLVSFDRSQKESLHRLFQRPGCMLINLSWIVAHLVTPKLDSP